jgi:hypothetical protein
MTNPTAEFFENLGHRVYEPLVSRVTGTMRFEVTNRGECLIYRLTIDRGKVAVTSDAGPADCVVRAERRVFDAMLTGRTDSMAAMLRGVLACEGNAEMLVLFRRVIAAAPAHARRSPAEPGPRPAPAAVETVAGW